MATQTLVWTALPNGLDADGNLRVSALVSPRLVPDADQILKPFGDFVDWPAAVRSAKFTIQYGASPTAYIPGDQGEGADRVDGTLALADSQTWRALFREETPVSGYVFKDLSQSAVLSYDTVAVDTMAQRLYAALARVASDSLPRVSQILGDPHWQRLIDSVAFMDGWFTERNTGRRDTEGQFNEFLKHGLLRLPDAVASILAQAQLFHTPPSKPATQDYTAAGLDADDPRLTSKTTWPTHERAALPAEEDFQKLVDFHQIVAAMSSFPLLLRRLGLVVDFVVDRGRFANAADLLLSVQCELDTDPAGVKKSSASNRTHARLTDREFSTVSKTIPASADDLRVLDGLLNLTPNQFAVLQSDVDAAGLKLMNFARTLHRMVGDVERQADPVTKIESQAGAPALRNAGLMLVHRRRAGMLKAAFTASLNKDNALKAALANPAASAPPELWAEDLVRGWRVDVWDDVSGVWHSLCERTARYTLDGGIILDDNSEGMLRLAATQSADGHNAKIVYLHEALLSWTGWSLAAPRPGLTIDKNDEVADPAAKVPPGIPMASEFKVKPGSLPRLRYGRTYRLRARAADLAANSLAPRADDFGAAQPTTQRVKYLRFEPLLPPTLALVRDGDTIEKPLEGEAMDRLAIRTFNDTPPDNVVPTAAVTSRRAVEARTTLYEAELHGALDNAGQVDGSASIYNMIVTKDQALGEVQLETPGPLAGGEPVLTTYAVLDAGAIDIPYLPDPMCVEMAARLLHHPTFADTELIPIPAYADGMTWPDASPFTIRILEDEAGTPHFDTATRVLEVPLPKAARVTLLLSCRLGDPAIMGVWNWLQVADRPAAAAAARNGRHWALTPWRVVELVHAVQRPLIAPSMKFSLERILWQTTVVPSFTATCSTSSTARVDLQAAWNEPDGDLDPAGGANRERNDHAFSVKITDPQTYASRDQNPAALGFAEHLLAGPDLIAVNENRDLAARKFHELNDTRYRRIEYWLEATTRFREYMPPHLLEEADKHITVIGEKVVAWVPNSAPPPAPKVLYVVPTFGWSRTTDAQGTEKRVRHGGGLRVYLDRPWNSSGYGEMLGVVLPLAAFTGDPNSEPAEKPYKKFVTQWGNDPIWESPFVPGVSPKLANFPLARLKADPTGSWLPVFAPPGEADQPPGPFKATDLPHPAIPLTDTLQFVDVAPHDVVYDSDRQLWYCDIDVNFGAAYFPFIRLALARYQPVSVVGAALSNVVLADFMALAPDRWLTLTAAAGGGSRHLTVFGQSYTDSSGRREASQASSTVPGPIGGPEIPASVSPASVVEIWVERLTAERGEDFGWVRDASAVVTKSEAGGGPFGPIGPLIPVGPPIAVRPNLATTAHIVRQRPGVSAADNLGPIVVEPGLFTPVLWEGTVTLPPNAQDRYRLVVAEYEEYLIDDATPYNPTPSAKGRRLVFVEHVPLS
jgi:hypothetical protein